MAKNSISLKQIATELGISISTVSRALKNHPDISANIKERVLELATSWNYDLSQQKQITNNSKHKTIGVIVPNIARFFYASILSGIENYAKKMGYFTVITNSNEQQETEIDCIDNLLHLNIDGMLVCLAHNTTKYTHFDKVKDQSTPLVFFDRVCRNNEFSSVIADNADAAKSIVMHLKLNGANRIAHIAGPKNLNISKERTAGYLLALNEGGLTFNPELLVNCDLSPEGALEATQTLLKVKPLPDAIFCVNDTVAYIAINELKKQGFNVPKDIAITGFNDEFHSSIIEPTLTTISHPTYEMGQEAARLLINQIELNKTVAPKQIVMKTKLIVRQSSIKQQNASY